MEECKERPKLCQLKVVLWFIDKNHDFKTEIIDLKQLELKQKDKAETFIDMGINGSHFTPSSDILVSE